MELRRLLPARLLAVIAAVTLLSPVPANAAPDDLPPPVDDPTTSMLSLADLGSDPDLAFYGQVGQTTLTVPVPLGMTPTSLNVMAQLPVDVLNGTVTVSQDNRVLSRVDVPAGPPAPLIIPLAGTQIVDNAVSVLLRSYLRPVDGYCLDPTNPLRLTDVTVSYAGVEQAPTVVADFLPPVLRKLSIYIGRTPSPAEADAAVQLAAAVASRYGRQNPEIDVVPLADPAVAPVELAGPLERHIAIVQGPNAGVSLYGSGPMPALLISGLANDLTNQTRLLTSGVARYALSSKAVAGPLNSAPQLPGNVTTLRRLGQPGVNATALNPQVVVALDQTRIGRPVRGVRVHLQGSYTPLPSALGGQVVASIAGETIDRWPAEADGVIDRWVDVPDRLLQRYTGLSLQVNISGNTGRCGEFQPITLTIDGESTVQTTLAAPPVPAGFQSMPQSLMPRVQVGIGDDVFGDTARAVEIVTGLQRLSALPMSTVVTSLADAIKSPNPAILISPATWNHADIPLPVTAPDTVPTTLNVVDDAGQATTLTLEPDLKFASLQTVYDGKRSLLVATSDGDPDQLDNLLQWLGADERRWSTIDGVALISVSGRGPVTIGAPTKTEASENASAQGTSHTLWWVAGGVGAVVAVAAAWAVLRSRRAKPGS